MCAHLRQGRQPCTGRCHLARMPMSGTCSRGSTAPGGGLGGTPGLGAEPVLRGHQFAAPKGLCQATARKALPRTRGDGKPDPGAAARPVRRSHQRVPVGGEPAVLVLLLLRLGATAGRCLGPQYDPVGAVGVPAGLPLRRTLRPGAGEPVPGTAEELLRLDGPSRSADNPCGAAQAEPAARGQPRHDPANCPAERAPDAPRASPCRLIVGATRQTLASRCNPGY